MNLYVIVEGRRTEPCLYRRWLRQLIPSLREVQRFEDASDDSFLVVAGYGYPSYKDRVRGAVEDCFRSKRPFHLLVCVDAEDVDFTSRLREISQTIEQAIRDAIESPEFQKSQGKGKDLPRSVIIADCCIETWLLGNRKLVRRNPQDGALRDYVQHYDVIAGDPELLPKKDGDRNRADTHHKYLKAVFRERGLSYSKSDPGDASEAHYFKAIAERASAVQEDGSRHLRSFARLLRLPDCLDSSELAQGRGGLSRARRLTRLSLHP